MKFVTLVCASVLLIVTAINAQVSVGLRGGYVRSELSATSAAGKAVKSATSPLNSWQAGVFFNVPLFRNGYLQPGLSFITKGANLENKGEQDAGLFLPAATRLKLQYLELPVNLVYKVPVGIGKLVFGGGPYAAFSLRADYDLAIYNQGKMIQSSSQRVDFSQDPNVFSTNINLHRWDAGVNATAGIEFNCYVTVGVNYSYGLMDINKSAGGLRNRYFGVSVGVLLNREDW